MKSRQAGFTMIELIVVIVILGILAATALPKFIDMRSDAYSASVSGFAGAMGSAMNLNYGGCQITNNVVTSGKCVQISACTQAPTLLQASLPTGYTVAASGTDIGTTNKNTAVCTVTSNSQTASFTGLSAGN